MENDCRWNRQWQGKFASLATGAICSAREDPEVIFFVAASAFSYGDPVGTHIFCMKTPFPEYLQHWSLIPDGPLIETSAALLLPVIWHDRQAMLKISTSLEEMQGYDLLDWWNGDGAVKIFARSGPAILMERSTGSRSLSEISRDGGDEQACRIICAVVGKLHSRRAGLPHTLSPLQAGFETLNTAASALNGVLHAAHQAMHELLAQPQEVTCLHGDIHHQNILDFGDRGWLAIDPKGLIGERGFDYANIFCNPDIETACDFDRFLSRVSFISRDAQLEPQRLLKWILAWAGLSAVWHLEDGGSPDIPLQVAGMAAGVLDF